MAQRLRNHMMSFPICGLSSSVRLALVALDSTSDVRRTADSSLRREEVKTRESVSGNTVSTSQKERRLEKRGVKKVSRKDEREISNDTD